MQGYNSEIDIPKNWISMGHSCIGKMRDQINKEVFASIQYLALGAHFSRDVINRPGFAKFFFDSASEEREHAKMLIDYLLTRGELTSFENNLISINVSFFLRLEGVKSDSGFRNRFFDQKKS